MTALELYSGLGRAEHSTSRELRAGVGELGEYREFRCARDVTRFRGKPRHIDPSKRTRRRARAHLGGIDRVVRLPGKLAGCGGPTADGGRGKKTDRAAGDRCGSDRPAIRRRQGANQAGPRPIEAEAG